MNYTITRQAEQDVEAIGDYIAVNSSLNRALRIVWEIRKEFGKIGEMPGLGHFRDDVADRRLKFWLIHSFLIAYRWEAKPIDIVAVIHGARDLTPILEDRLD